MPDAIVSYHQRSKHHLDHYALGPDGMDWATVTDRPYGAI